MNKRIVDFHAHPVTDEFRTSMDYLGINPIAEDGFPLPKWSVDEHLDFMKNSGIDYTVLSVPAPHIHNGDNRKSRNAARKINLSVAEICKSHSDKFGFASCVPLPDTEGAVAETAYAMDELGAVGVNQTEDKYMKTKIALLLLTIIVFILSLAACSGNTDRQTSQSQPDTSAARNQPDETQGTAVEPETNAGKTLVVYFSATGTTKGVAEKIAKVTNADIYEIRAAQAYTDADLN